MDSHMNGRHMNMKRYTCRVCSYASYRRNTVKEHIQIVHEGMKHKCPTCLKVKSSALNNMRVGVNFC